MKRSVIIGPLILALALQLLYTSCTNPKNNSTLSTESLLQNLVKRNKTPSVRYFLFDIDTILVSHSYGLANIKSGQPNDPTLTCNAFSVTKTFTALAILQLVEAEKLALDESVIKYLDEFPYAEEITVSQLLSHTGGIPNPIPLSWIHLISEHSQIDSKTYFTSIFSKHSKLKSAPGQKFRYSNLGYVILGELIEKVSGQTYEEYIQQHIIKKLELRPEELGFQIMDPDRHAKGYQKKNSLFNLILGNFLDKGKFMSKAEKKWKPFKFYYLNGAAYGGLIGSPLAFVKYIQALLRSESPLISESYKKLMLTEVKAKQKSTGMCLSWFTDQLGGQTYFSHAGGGGGYYCEIRMYPDLGLGSVVFFNRTGTSDQRFLDHPDKIYFQENGLLN